MAAEVSIEYKVNDEVIKDVIKDVDNLKQSNEDVSDSVKKTDQSFSSLGDQLKNVGNQVNFMGVGLGDLAGKATGATKGIGSITTGFKVLDKVLKASIIGIIVTAVVALGVALTKSSKGVEIMRAVMDKLQGVFNGVISVITNMSSILSGKKGLTETFTKQVKETERLNKASRDLERSQAKLAEVFAKGQKSVEAYNAMADDATLSLQQQQEYAEKAAQAEEKLIEMKLLAARQLRDQFQAELDIKAERERLTNDDIKERSEYNAAVIDLESELAVSRLNNATRLRQIDQDTWEQRLDFLIDYTDNQKTINERQIMDERLTLERRREIYDETVAMTDAAFEKAFKSFEDQAGQRLDINMLLEESDANVVSEYLRGTQLSEIETTRMLEFLRERKTFTQDLADVERELNNRAEQERNERLDRQQERSQREFEARLELSLMQFETEYEQEEARLTAMKNLDLLNTELTESERLLILEQYENDVADLRKRKREEDLALEQQYQDAKLNLEMQTASSIGNLFSTLADQSLGFAIFSLAIEKGLAIAEVFISLQKELAAISANAAANPLNAITFGTAGLAQQAKLSSLAKVNAGIRIGTIGAQAIQQVAGFNKGVIDLNGQDGIDRIPAMLTRGESVMTQSETRKFLPTLKAIRAGNVDPDLLNGIVLGDPRVINNTVVSEVPRDSITIDENGFQAKMIRGASEYSIKQNRFKW